MLSYLRLRSPECPGFVDRHGRADGASGGQSSIKSAEKTNTETPTEAITQAGNGHLLRTQPNRPDGTSTLSEQSRRVHSPDVPSPNTGQAETVTSDNEDEVPTQVADPFEDLPANQAPVHVPEEMLFMEEKKLRQRKSGTSETRAKIAAVDNIVRTHAEPVPRKGYLSWDQVMLALEAYSRATGFHFRIRSGVKVANWTDPSGTEIPVSFTYGFKNLRCAHGFTQPSRASGDREAHSNYTGCEARFDAFVTLVSTSREGKVWSILVKNEWRLHNYHAETSRAVRGNQEVPSEGPLADNIADLSDAGAGSRQIAAYASSELGE
ncbi:hypothetical protein GN244_ATG15239 [Phytophthora infestans]|uniref:Uncharacterized protein n=1 Tax=Phytophthora infestans TaxID=4787 RepID=A0A833SMG1_PHYIN|nr:hypothetical protein GN244_ATG15239 [Phytophthora infestans]